LAMLRADGEEHRVEPAFTGRASSTSVTFELSSSSTPRSRMRWISAFQHLAPAGGTSDAEAHHAARHRPARGSSPRGPAGRGDRRRKGPKAPPRPPAPACPSLVAGRSNFSHWRNASSPRKRLDGVDADALDRAVRGCTSFRRGDSRRGPSPRARVCHRVSTRKARASLSSHRPPRGTASLGCSLPAGQRGCRRAGDPRTRAARCARSPCVGARPRARVEVMAKGLPSSRSLRGMAAQPEAADCCAVRHLLASFPDDVVAGG